MNGSGGITNHFWLLSAWEKEMLLDENYSLCSSYLQFFKQNSIPPSICWQPAGASQPCARANGRRDPAQGLEVTGLLPQVPFHLRATPILLPSCSSGTGYSINITSLTDPQNMHQGFPAVTRWATSS